LGSIHAKSLITAAQTTEPSLQTTANSNSPCYSSILIITSDSSAVHTGYAACYRLHHAHQTSSSSTSYLLHKWVASRTLYGAAHYQCRLHSLFHIASQPASSNSGIHHSTCCIILSPHSTAIQLTGALIPHCTRAPVAQLIASSKARYPHRDRITVPLNYTHRTSHIVMGINKEAEGEEPGEEGVEISLVESDGSPGPTPMIVHVRVLHKQ